MRRRLLAWVSVAGSIVVAAAFGSACGTQPSNVFGTDDGGTGDSGSGDDSLLPDLPDGASGDGTTNCTQCSGDLHNVLTCGDNPQVVQTCTGDQGCGPNGCINACDAAAANKSSIGCDYYAIPADGWNASYSSGGAAGNCFAAFVTNNWTSPMKVSLVWKGNTIDATPYSYIPQGSGSGITYQPVPNTGIPQNSMAIVFLNQTIGGGGLKVQCPSSVKVAVENEDMVIHGTAIANAMQIKTTVPAVVYDIYPYGGATSYISSATLLLPTTAWDTNFVAVTMDSNISFPPGIDVIARDDGTQVTILPSNNILAGTGVAAATKGVPVTYNLNHGQNLHLTQKLDLTGSIIQSNNPVGVWGEHFCMFQNSPPSWRIVGAVDGTTLTYDPPVSGAPTTLNRGQLVEFGAGSTAFRVISQDDKHPFYLAAHRPGGDCDAAHQQIPPVKALGSDYVAVGNEAANYGIGGPETVNVVPPQQFLSSYIFFSDPTYGYTDLALTRGKASDNTYKDVTLDCLGTVTGWTQIGGTQYQQAHVFLQKNKAPVGNCNNGLHTIKSTANFGITVYGYDSASSYAYPAGASVKPINTVVVPPVPN